MTPNVAQGPLRVEDMLADVLRHGELKDRDVLSLIWMATAICLAIYIAYGFFVSWLLESTIIPVKLNVHVLRDTHPLCAKCAGGACRTYWQTHIFTFYTPHWEPTRIRFINDFVNEEPVDLLEGPAAINSVEIHDCGGIRDIIYEVSAEDESTQLLCLPSQDYANILLEEHESYFIDPNKLLRFSLAADCGLYPRTGIQPGWPFCCHGGSRLVLWKLLRTFSIWPRTMYVAWGRVTLWENYECLAPGKSVCEEGDHFPQLTPSACIGCIKSIVH